MTDQKYNVDLEKLPSLNLFQLREVGSKIGVRNPTALKADELRAAIIDVVNGVAQPYRKVKSGRPHSKELIPDDEWDRIIGFDDQMKKKFNTMPSNTLFSNDASLIKQSKDTVFKGYIAVLGANKYFFPCKSAEVCFDVFLKVDYDIPYFDSLRNSDYVTCILNLTLKNPTVIKILSINGYEPEELKRQDFDEMKQIPLESTINFERNNLQFLNNVCPIKLGGRVMILGTKASGQNYLCNSIAKDLEERYSIIYLSICKKPEERVNLKNSEYLFTTFDAQPRDINFYFDLLNDRVKRLCEFGQDVVLIVDDIVDLMENLKSVITARQQNMPISMYYPNILQQLKRLLANSIHTENGSITIICAGSNDCDDAQFREYCAELDKLCNTHIKLDRVAYTQGKDEFFDAENTYSEVVRTL